MLGQLKSAQTNPCQPNPSKLIVTEETNAKMSALRNFLVICALSVSLSSALQLERRTGVPQLSAQSARDLVADCLEKVRLPANKANIIAYEGSLNSAATAVERQTILNNQLVPLLHTILDPVLTGYGLLLAKPRWRSVRSKTSQSRTTISRMISICLRAY